ncbi:winged helix-turn-helix domain-containing protein [Natronosalvus vescus]|uniref:winged helix-turn-helix domain-containing protein n=1 Tax=Natronosalvus vescus TaxID=2953881 RepID=UPI0020900550|nr:helix-turn-helix domain-containing protein [Natronosalvus vescus]
MSHSTIQHHPCGISDGEDGCKPEQIITLLAENTARQLFLHADGPTTVQEFCDELDVAMTTAYRTVERLEDAGLLKRQPPTASPQTYVRASEHVTITYENPVRISCVKGGVPVYCEL